MQRPASVEMRLFLARIGGNDRASIFLLVGRNDHANAAAGDIEIRGGILVGHMGLQPGRFEPRAKQLGFRQVESSKYNHRVHIASYHNSRNALPQLKRPGDVGAI